MVALSASELIFVVGAGALAAGALLPLTSRRWQAALLIQAAGLVCIGCGAGAVALGARPFGAGFHDGYAPALGVDRLSGFFLALLALVAVPAVVHACGGLSATVGGPSATLGGPSAALGGPSITVGGPSITVDGGESRRGGDFLPRRPERGGRGRPGRGAVEEPGALEVRGAVKDRGTGWRPLERGAREQTGAVEERGAREQPDSVEERGALEERGAINDREAVGDGRARALTSLTACFCLALTGLLVARDVASFLAFWELMTLLPAVAILVVNHGPGARRDVFTYLTVTHLGGVAVWSALLLLAHHGALGGTPLHSALLRSVVAALAMVGFGTKSGLMPMHSWLPKAHPLAPPHISALMSGVMVKVALYGLIRVLFQWDAPTPLWVAITLLGLGTVSALGGITAAISQRELKTLLAYCTVENVGVIVVGLGASLLLGATGHPQWATVAFAAAMLQTLTHAVAKGLMFLAAGSLASVAGKLELDRLGGLLVRMPFTGGAMVLGALSLAGIPPLGGFASEWLTLESLIHVAVQTASRQPGAALAGGLAAVLVAGAAAVAVLAFVTVIGITLLGAPRRPELATVSETRAWMWAPLAALAGLCLATGILPGLLLPTLAALRPVAGAAAGKVAGAAGGVSGAAAGRVGAGLHAGTGLNLPGTTSLPALGLAGALVIVVAGLWIARRGRRPAPVPSPTPAWTCGAPVRPSLAWSAAGFTETLRLMSGGVLPALLAVRVQEPTARLALRGAGLVRRLQSGSLTNYLGYLLGLLTLLLAMMRLGWLS